MTPIEFHNSQIIQNGLLRSTGFSNRSQEIRYRVIHQSVGNPKSILDYGCGPGGLLDYLRKLGWSGEYTGMDLNPAYDTNGTRIIGDILEVGKIDQHEAVVASGSFCYLSTAERNWERLFRLWEVCTQVLVVNFLTTLVPDNLRSTHAWHQFYSPQSILDFSINKLRCRSFNLKHDYLHNDFTVVLRKRFTDSDVIA